MNISYLDTISWFQARAYSGINITQFPTSSAAYVSVLVASEDVRNGPQDGFRNVKIPIIEYLDGSGGISFTNVSSGGDVQWSSLLGMLPSVLHGLVCQKFVRHTLVINNGRHFHRQRQWHSLPISHHVCVAGGREH